MSDLIPLPLREFHEQLGAKFTGVNGAEVVADYGDTLAEHAALTSTAGVLDLSFRGRVCLTGADRARFLHGQVTNDVQRLKPGGLAPEIGFSAPQPSPAPTTVGAPSPAPAGEGQGGEGSRNGCYAALVTAKGKMEGDLHIHCLADELLLDFEPGLTAAVTARLEKFIVADDVQVVDVAPFYGLLSMQGPKAEEIVRSLGVFAEVPSKPYASVKLNDDMLGEVYLMNMPRIEGRAGSPLHAEGGSETSKRMQPTDGAHGLSRHSGATAEVTRPTIDGFDLYVPAAGLGAVLDKLVAAAKGIGGRACGWTALETARIEAGIPRFGADMDESNIPIECGIEARAISYKKGCYIGQEVINRIHSMGHVNRELRGLRLADGPLPVKGDKLFHAGKEVGHITSAVRSPSLQANIALGYVRREAMAVGMELMVKTASGESAAKVVGFEMGLRG